MPFLIQPGLSLSRFINLSMRHHALKRAIWRNSQDFQGMNRDEVSYIVRHLVPGLRHR
jgi:hypothetical protein